jgi:hypothetical protein
MGPIWDPLFKKNPLVKVQLQACKQAEKCEKNPTEFKTPSGKKKKKKFLFSGRPSTLMPSYVRH